MTSRSSTPRRRWSTAFKKRVVAEAIQPGVSTAQIARRHDLNSNLVLNWKKKFGSSATLVPVEITTDDDGLRTALQLSLPCVEIDLPCGTTVRCGADPGIELVTEIITTLRSKR